MLKRYTIGAACYIAFLILVDRASLFFPPCFTYRLSPQESHTIETHKDYCSSRDSLIVAGVKTLYSLPPEGWTALATIVIASFTATLWWATNIHARHMEQMVSIQRAFVFLERFDYELTTAADNKTPIEKLPKNYEDHPDLFITRFTIQPIWRNSGNTPPKDMKINVNYWVPPGTWPLTFGYRSGPKDFFIPPQGTEGSDFIEITGTQVLIDRGMGFLFGADDLVIAIWGRADYADIFGKNHFIEWCYQLRYDRIEERLRARFIQWGTHNRSDEDT